MELTQRGYGGKILHLVLSTLDYEVIPTEKYTQWGGGNGLATALFWDYCQDKTITDGREEANVVVIATSPLCGTMAPSAGGRCEIVGVGVGQYPVSWFTRSNIGGRLSTMLKYAGWDAVVISGKAPKPVWVEITNDKVTYHDARDVWKKDSKQTQIDLFTKLDRGGEGWGWQELPGKDDGVSYTTQKPAIMCIAQSGVSQVALASLIHDAGNASGQGGFGAVFGSKNLKAISVIGTGGVKATDPTALVHARFRVKERYAPDVHAPDVYHWGWLGNPMTINFAGRMLQSRRSSCAGCFMGCRTRFDLGYGNEIKCQTSGWYAQYAMRYFKGDSDKVTKMALRVGDYCNIMAVNSYGFQTVVPWLESLWHKGLLGKDKALHTELDFSKIGSWEFAKALIDAFAYKRDVGALFADGVIPGAIKSGFEKEWREGTLDYPYWGIQEHGYDPRAEVEWGFASIMTDRDINSHDFNGIFWGATINTLDGIPPLIEAEELANIVAKKLHPYVKDANCLNYAEDNIYSDDVLQLVRWYIHYNRFWKNSALFCDFRWSDLYDTNAKDNVGATADPEVGEQVYWNAVTGEGIEFVEGLAKGHRIFVLQNAIWALQGRHRDIVHFADFIYEKELDETETPFFMWPTKDENGVWQYSDIKNRKIDKAKFEEWKSRFYKAEGLDPKTGWPTKETLLALGLDDVIPELQQYGKLPKES